MTLHFNIIKGNVLFISYFVVVRSLNVILSNIKKNKNSKKSYKVLSSHRNTYYKRDERQENRELHN